MKKPFWILILILVVANYIAVYHGGLGDLSCIERLELGALLLLCDLVIAMLAFAVFEKQD